MSRKMLFGAVAALSLLFASGVEAQTARDLTPEQDTAFQAAQVKPSTLSILTLLDRQDATYAVGETVRLAIKSNEDAYVTVFNVGASGKVTQLFPNAYQTDNRVKAGEAVEIPSAASGAQIRVTGPVGGELIKVIATSKPVTIIPDTQFTKDSGIFRSLEGGVEALKRDLDVVSTNPPADLKVAVLNQVVKSIATRLPGSVTSVTASTSPSQATTGAALPVVGSVPQTFPLLLATEKPSYRVGDRPTIAVTSLQACHLTVWSTNAVGQARLLFPSAAAPADQIGALQTLMISGGPALQSVVASAPGTEILTALCTTEARSLPFAPRSAADVLTAEEKSALDRDLAVVPTRPAGTYGLSQVSVIVTP